MKRYLPVRIVMIVLSVLLQASQASSQPSISGVSGPLVSGAQITISGTGFGSKVPAAPFKWDNFEWGSVGNSLTLNGWTHFDASSFPALGNNTAYAGSLSAYKQVNGNPTVQTDYLSIVPGSLELFASYRVYLDYPAGVSADAKLSRFNSGTVYAGNPALRNGYQPQINWDSIKMHNGVDEWRANVDDTKLSPRVWHKEEIYVRLSNPPGASNGEVTMSMDDVPQTLVWVPQLTAPAWNNVTRAAGVTGLWDFFMLPFMWANILPTGTIIPINVDDVYIDITRARVEICDASTWSACTQKELQIPSAWSSTSLVVTVNQGRFSSVTGHYLYVMDSNGNVNANGFLLGSAPVPPNAPMGLSAQ